MEEMMKDGNTKNNIRNTESENDRRKESIT